MGFKNADAINALVNTNSLDEAVELLFLGADLGGDQNVDVVYPQINVDESFSGQIENPGFVNPSNSVGVVGGFVGSGSEQNGPMMQGISLPKTGHMPPPLLMNNPNLPQVPVPGLNMSPIPPLPSFPVVNQNPHFNTKPVYTKSGFLAPKVDKPISIPGFNPNNPSIPPLLNPGKSGGMVNEDFREFLNIRLVKQGLPADLIQEIVSNCGSKEEALLILNIPMSLKDTPLSKIAHDLDNKLKSPIIPEAKAPGDSLSMYIKSQLISEGIDPNNAEILSISCSSLEEAYANLESTAPVYPKPPQPQFFGHPLPPKIPPFIPPPNLVNPVKPNFKNYKFPPPPYPGPPPLFSNSSSSESYSDEYNMFHSNHRSNCVNLAAPTESDPVAPDLKTEYFERLQNYRLSMTEDPSVFQLFNLGSANGSAQSLKRINTEMKVLSTSVPCDSTASVFVVIDSACMHRIKFILSGTMDTPYAHGLYLFDALLPSNYPQTPPKVNIITTGNGHIRFNPNLYNNGYVCLSIIGTWSGRPEEQWNPSSSTLLQVILSIQSLVMDNDIIQKEPSFHSMPRNSHENMGYQLEVKYGNLKYAMIEMIRTPPKGFEAAVREHFRIKKKEVLDTARLWMEESKKISHAPSGTQNPEINALLNRNKPVNVFKELYHELEGLLNSL